MSINAKRDGRGRLRHQVYVYDSSLQKKRYVGTFDRAKDAEDAEQEAKRRLRLGEPVKPEPAREEIAFDHLAKKWQATLSHVRPATKQDYQTALRRVSPVIGRLYVSCISRKDIDLLIAALTDRYAACTVRKTLTVTKMVFRVAIDWGYIDTMPTGGSRLNLPKVKKRRFDPLTREAVNRLIEAAPAYWKPWFLFMLTSGCRRAEAFGACVVDLDLNAGCIRIRHQLIRGRLVDLKSDASDRRVPLPGQTVEALREHLSVRPDNELGLLFPTPEGKPVDADNFYARVWMPARKAAGLPSLRIHDCRHHVASLLLSQHHSIKYVQQVMGHATASVLLDIYAHVTAGEEQKAQGDMERWLGEEELARYAA